jgi:hypothetical protein
MSSIGKQRYTEKTGTDQSPFDKMQTNLEGALIATVKSIHQMVQTIAIDVVTDRDAPVGTKFGADVK